MTPAEIYTQMSAALEPSGKTDPPDSRGKAGIVADQVPGRVHLEKDETRRAFGEHVIEVAERLLPITEPRMRPGEVERRDVIGGRVGLEVLELSLRRQPVDRAIALFTTRGLERVEQPVVAGKLVGAAAHLERLVEAALLAPDLGQAEERVWRRLLVNGLLIQRRGG